MDQNEKDKIKSLVTKELYEIIISNPLKNEKHVRILIKKTILKSKECFTIESFTKTQAFQKNVSLNELVEILPAYFEDHFKQALFKYPENEVQVLVSKKGKISFITNKISKPVKEINLSHNKVKNHLLQDGVFVPFLYELGVMSKDGHVKKERYDKFKQINRFLEFIDDVVPSLPTDRPVNILDFGCGKSYLTFAVYHFLTVEKHLTVNITGLDLKQDVIEHCNSLAKKLEYRNLTFLNGNIADYEGTADVDMMLTLHACDTATDYALYKAIKWNAKVILSVPCCQHEMNKTIACESLSSLFDYGLIKERTAALFTDAIRANILNAYGYKTQLLEFIDMEHTPKNILIRGVKNSNSSEHDLSEVKKTLQFINGTSTLFNLLDK